MNTTIEWTQIAITHVSKVAITYTYVCKLPAHYVHSVPIARQTKLHNKYCDVGCTHASRVTYLVYATLCI